MGDLAVALIRRYTGSHGRSLHDGCGASFEIVSFDLYAFPPDGPQTVGEMRNVMEAEEERLMAGETDSDQRRLSTFERQKVRIITVPSWLPPRVG